MFVIFGDVGFKVSLVSSSHPSGRAAIISGPQVADSTFVIGGARSI